MNNDALDVALIEVLNYIGQQLNNQNIIQALITLDKVNKFLTYKYHSSDIYTLEDVKPLIRRTILYLKLSKIQDQNILETINSCYKCLNHIIYEDLKSLYDEIQNAIDALLPLQKDSINL
jgi:hypothetical protein